MPAPTLIASSQTKEGLEKLLSQYFYSVITIDAPAIKNSKGIIPGYSISLKKGRFICHQLPATSIRINH